MLAYYESVSFLLKFVDFKWSLSFHKNFNVFQRKLQRVIVIFFTKCMYQFITVRYIPNVPR